MMIPYGKQSINEDDIAAVVSALRGDFLTTGPLVEAFELELEKIVGAPCVSVSSGTAALHCAYAAIDLQPGDEVITPPITFIATQATAAMFGAKIVFVDVQIDTGNIDPNLVEEAITNRTKAIVAVDYAGHPADLDELRIIADKYGLYLIEDAAHSLGSTYKGKPVGSVADLTTFSFFPTKNITTAEGGAVASIHPELLTKAKRFSRQGLIRDKKLHKITSEGIWHQEVHDFGLNYRLPDVLCALGISQTRRIETFKQKRLEIFRTYNNFLRQNHYIKLPIKKPNVSPMWHFYPVRVHKTKRLELFNFLRNKGVGVQVNYLPAYKHPVFYNEKQNFRNFEMSENFYNEEISLPVFNDLQEKDIQKVVELLNGYFRI